MMRKLSRRPLSALTFIRRNPGKSGALIFVVALAVMLVMSTLSMIRAIRWTDHIRAGHTKHYLVITPRQVLTLPEGIQEELQAKSPVPVEKQIVARTSRAVLKGLVGELPVPVYAFAPDDMLYFLRKIGAGHLEGRYPRPDQPEAIVSWPVAKNRNLKIGSILLKPQNERAYSPKPVKVVGIVDSENWLMIVPMGYHRKYHPIPIDLLMVFAQNLDQQRRLDAWVEAEMKNREVAVHTYAKTEKIVEKTFRELFRLLGVITGTIVLIITLITALLMNIYQAQRVQEYGLLQALGYSRLSLLRRAIGESLFVTLLGWILGLACNAALLIIVKKNLIEPGGYVLYVFDPPTWAQALWVPVAIFMTSSLTFWLKFRRFDPVLVIERRLL